MKVILAGAALSCAPFSLCAAAQVAAPATGQSAAVITEAAPAAATATSCTGCFTIPALTPVTVEVRATVGSKISKAGDTFPIRLITPIIVDGKEVIPTGTMGMGEVVHAKKGGGSGSAGELVLAARYLEVGGQRLRLRSMHLSPNGRSRTKTVETIMVASAVVAPALSVVGLFVKGGDSTVQEGSFADAKTAEPFTLAAPVPALAQHAAPNPPTAPAPVVQPAPQEEGSK